MLPQRAINPPQPRRVRNRSRDAPSRASTTTDPTSGDDQGVGVVRALHAGRGARALDQLLGEFVLVPFVDVVGAPGPLLDLRVAAADVLVPDTVARLRVRG